MNIIFIDTTSNEEITVALIMNGKQFEKKAKVGRDRPQMVLPLLDQLLKENTLSLKDIDEIEVREGPGSFTGIRVGFSIGNALGYSLGVPVNGKKA